MSDDNFSANFFPQSVYRKHHSDEREAHSIDVNLQPVELDASLVPELKARITLESENMIRLLFPERRIEAIHKDGHLKKIFQRLHLS